ncbi:MAG TPA: DUF3084 domain-containing protein [Capillibacterium sp.]
MYGVILVLTIAFLGGLIALLGDRIGMKVGKKRLSIFGLRPKYTSMLITVVTGILIAGTTLLLLALVSNDVRTALFRMKTLKQELAATKAELVLEQERLTELEVVTKELQESKVALEVEKERLRKEIQAYSGEASFLRANGQMNATGRYIFTEGEILATAVVTAGADPAAIQRQLDTLVQTANQLALARGARLPGKNDEALVLGAEFPSLPAYGAWLAAAEKPGVLRLVATRNTEVFTALEISFAYFPNRRVFQAGELLGELAVSPFTAEEELLDRIVGLLAEIKQTAVRKGMRVEGLSLSQILSPAEITAAIGRIKAEKRERVLRLVAAADFQVIDQGLKVEIAWETMGDANDSSD